MIIQLLKDGRSINNRRISLSLTTKKDCMLNSETFSKIPKMYFDRWDRSSGGSSHTGLTSVERGMSIVLATFLLLLLALQEDVSNPRCSQWVTNLFHPNILCGSYNSINEDKTVLHPEQRKKQQASDSSAVGRQRRRWRRTFAGFLFKGKLNLDFRNLDLWEVGCRGRESCLSRGSKGTALMIRLRSNQVECAKPDFYLLHHIWLQAKKLLAMGWECPKLKLWIWQDEVGVRW